MVIKVIKLYLDCDGVILNTIDTVKELMIKDGIEPKDELIVHDYFISKIDWNILIKEAGILKDALNKIKFLLSLGIYDARILTTITCLMEPSCKINYFNKNLPGIEVITVPWGVRKDNVVDARNSILVDDSKNNILNWRLAGGLGLHYVNENPNYNLMEISDLLSIVRFNGEIEDRNVKRLIR